MVRPFTTVRPLKDFVSPSTSMTISGAAADGGVEVTAAGTSVTSLGPGAA